MKQTIYKLTSDNYTIPGDRMQSRACPVAIIYLYMDIRRIKAVLALLTIGILGGIAPLFMKIAA